MLKSLERARAQTARARQIYGQIVARARMPEFFVRFGVADTLDGRFDLVVLHAWLVLDGLRGPLHRELSQNLTNLIFAGFDEGLRELGAGDMGMGRKMKKMADAFYGRAAAYDDAADEPAMAAAILRNVYRGVETYGAEATVLARYVLAARDRLRAADRAWDTVDFGPMPDRAP